MNVPAATKITPKCFKSWLRQQAPQIKKEITSVEETLAQMDIDKDGQVTVSDVYHKANWALWRKWAFAVESGSREGEGEDEEGGEGGEGGEDGEDGEGGEGGEGDEGEGVEGRDGEGEGEEGEDSEREDGESNDSR